MKRDRRLLQTTYKLYPCNEVYTIDHKGLYEAFTACILILDVIFVLNQEECSDKEINTTRC